MSELSKSTKNRIARIAARSPTGRGGGGGMRFPSSPTGGIPAQMQKAFNSPASPQTMTSSFNNNNDAENSKNSDAGEDGGAQQDHAQTPAKKRRRKEGRGSGEGDQQPAEKGAVTVRGTVPSITLSDLGGLQRELPVIEDLIETPIKCPHLFSRLGADPPSGVLLHGPPGCGKTKLAHAIAGTLKCPLFSVSGPEIVQGVAGDSEAQLRTIFQDAVAEAPSIVFIDELDTIAGRRDSSQHEMQKRIVAQLLTCMDQLHQAWREHGKIVCIIGATNRPEAIDTGLRRAGRFDREIALGIPTLEERKEILKVLTKGLALDTAVDFFELANMTPGYVGADLHLLVKEASVVAIKRKHTELAKANAVNDFESPLLNGFCVMADELRLATKRVQPSAMREGFTTIPNVTWADVGALEEARRELKTSILQPIRSPKLHLRMGLNNPVGVLLYGPPGCGKTLVAKAIANESGANFISIKGPELLNKFVGESERSVRMVFARGRASAPCVLFFDELDALAPRRGSDRANASSERVVNQLLTEMDGVEVRSQVYVVAATNRPDMIDPAMLRPGRLDKLLYVPLPDGDQRVSILETCARRFPLHPSVDLKAVGHSKRLEGFSGADLASLLREASFIALKSLYATLSPTELDAFEKVDDLDEMSSGVHHPPAADEDEIPFPFAANEEASSSPAPADIVTDTTMTAEPTDAVLRSVVSNQEATHHHNANRLPFVLPEHIEAAMDKIKPSVSEQDRESYRELHQKHSEAPRRE